MMLPSHLLATILAGQLAGHALGKRLAPKTWLLALAFGVAIDVDHLVQLPAYVAMHGMAALQPGPMLAWGSQWQGALHTPWALLLVLPASLAFRSFAPLLAWAGHMVLDFVVARHFVEWGGPLEWTIVAALLAAVGAMWAHDHRAHGAGSPFLRHVATSLGLWR